MSSRTLMYLLLGIFCAILYCGFKIGTAYQRYQTEPIIIYKPLCGKPTFM